MFFKRKSNIMARYYESFCYITDDRNYSYIKTSEDDFCIGDKVLSESGGIFFSVLDVIPIDIDYLLEEIVKKISGVEVKMILDDVMEFYNMLENDGFIVSGNSEDECESKDIKSIYNRVELDTTNNERHKNSTNIETQSFFEDYFKGEPQLRSLHIEITGKCNERCVHCYIPHNKKINDMESEMFYDIIEQAIDLKLLHITISGGEPMLHNSFIEFIKKCKELNLSVSVLSNLTLLTDEIIQEIKDYPLLGIQVSLYSMNPDIHDEITQVKGSFKKTFDGILKLIEYNIPMQISCPILTLNRYCCDDIRKWAAQYNIHVGSDYAIIGSYDSTTENLINRMSIYEINDFVRKQVLNDVSYVENIDNDALKKKSKSLDDFVCSVCQTSLCITENGVVYPCAGWQSYEVGNVKDQKIEDIWRNSDKIKYLRRLRRKDFRECINCNDYEYCTMCMVRNANENESSDPLVVSKFYCKIASMNREVVTEWKNARK